MNVCVFGLWHLGCVTAACLSDLGIKVTGLDFQKKTIKKLIKGKSPIFEPGLEEIIEKNVNNGNLNFTIDKSIALKNADYIWIAFDTPVNNNDKADIEFVKKQIDLISDCIQDKTKIILSSQVPVGFTKEIEELFEKKYPDKKIFFAYSPENLRLGKAIQVFKNPDRIIIGIRNKSDQIEFESIFLKISDKLEWMKTESAEMTKHAINSFLATSVVFANEIASICESVGADAKEVARGLKTEERIGQKAYVGPGLAFAGGTLARDINFLINISNHFGKKSFLFKAVKQSNQNHKNWIKQKCLEQFKEIKNIKFGLLGLTYKPNTSTLRRSSVIELAKWINENGGIISSFDPIVEPIPEKINKVINLKKTIEEVIEISDCIIIGTEHKIFQSIDFIKFDLKNKIIIDPTSYIEKNINENIIVKYLSVGRG